MKKILEILMFASLGIFFFVCSTSEVFALSATKNTLGFRFKNFPQTYWTGNDIFNRLSVQLSDNLNDNSISIQSEFYNINYEKILFSSSFCMSVSFDGTVYFWDKNTEVKRTNNVCVFDDGSAGMRYDFSKIIPLQQVSSANMGTYTMGFRFQKNTTEWSYFQLLSLNFTSYDATSAITGSIVGGNDKIINKIDESTNSITGSIIGGKNDIINNQDKNNQDLIDNQNKNHQEQIENDNKNQQETNERLDGIKDSINDDTPPEVNNAFGDIKLDKDSAISDLLLLPIKYLQRILNLSSKTCSSYSLNFGIFNSDYILKMPCINLENFFGSQLWATIDYLICFFMIYEICMLFVSAFEDLTSLRDTYDSLYQPKHAEGEYQGKHGGGS